MKKKIEIEVEIPDNIKFGIQWTKLWRDFNGLHKKAGRIPDWRVQRKQIERLVIEQLENLNK